jgi:hypothetical protein
MRIKGRTSQWEEELRADQRKAARGKLGVRTRASTGTRTCLEEGDESLAPFLGLRRGLWAAELVIAIMTVY